MRWSIVRLICTRELRDQLRDRRTIFMIAVLPVLLYPILGTALFQFAGFTEKPSVVGIVGDKNLPDLAPCSLGFAPPPITAFFVATPISICQEGPAAAVGA